jgi:hypothetical protein
LRTGVEEKKYRDTCPPVLTEQHSAREKEM